MLKKLISAMLDALQNNKDFVLCSIIDSTGSAPRGSGAKMVVFGDGSTLGTIGGGAVEYKSVHCAREALRKRSAFIRNFDLSPNETNDIGMVCGGKVVVYFQYWEGSDTTAVKMLDYIVSLYDQKINAWLITRIHESPAWQMGVYEEGIGLQFIDMPDDVIKPMLSSHTILSQNEPTYYVEPLVKAGTVYVFGGGHVGRAFTNHIKHLDFCITVIDDREGIFDNYEDDINTIAGEYSQIISKIEFSEDSFVLIATHEHIQDYNVLKSVLGKPDQPTYIGLLSSKTKVKGFVDRIHKDFSRDIDLSCLYSPAGLDIGGATPDEIAISIIAEIQTIKYMKDGHKHMRAQWYL